MTKALALRLARNLGVTYSSLHEDFVAPHGMVFASTGTHCVRVLDWPTAVEDLKQGLWDCEDYATCEWCQTR